MTNEKKLGIWMDHANAYLIDHATSMIISTIVSESTHEEKEFTLQKGESFMQRKNQQQMGDYYKSIGEVIKHYDEVLLFGPTDARLELHNLLKEDMHFDNIKFETKPSDKITDNQKIAFVRDHFSKK